MSRLQSDEYPAHIEYPEEMNRQHMLLYQLFDEARTRISTLDPEWIKGRFQWRHEVIRDIMHDAMHLADLHFSWENRLMDAIDVAWIEDPNRPSSYTKHMVEHKREHAIMLEAAQGYYQHSESSALSPLTLYSFLRAWLTTHISKFDLVLAGYAKAVGPRLIIPEAPEMGMFQRTRKPITLP